MYGNPFADMEKPMLQIRLWRNIPPSALFRRRTVYAYGIALDALDLGRPQILQH